MRAKYGYAEFLRNSGRLEEAIQHYEDLLELNENDNQGVRYELFTAFMKLDLLNKAEALLNKINETSTAFGVYNRVLIECSQNGATFKAKRLLQNAKKQNPYVLDYLLGHKNVPQYIPDGYQPGDELEAVIYVEQHLDIWQRNPKLIDFLKK